MTADNAASVKYRWRLYFAHGRHQIRIGVRRERPDRVSPEYRFVSLSWQL
jgi:hypothetical protein